VKKGLVPEGLVTEPQIVALGCESRVVLIRLGHDDIHVVFDAERPAVERPAATVALTWQPGSPPVRSNRLILIEAPSSAYHVVCWGWEKQPKERRRPHAILQGAALGRVAMRA
jgi:hypothetical protein